MSFCGVGDAGVRAPASTGFLASEPFAVAKGLGLKEYRGEKREAFKRRQDRQVVTC